MNNTTETTSRKSPAKRQHVVDSRQASAAWAVITGQATDGSLEVDQICSSADEARREVKDLKAMGFEDARAKRFASWGEAEDYSDKVRGY